MSPRRQAPLALEYILLGFLEQNPIHGYELYKKIANFEGAFLVWRIKQSQLYALLDKLEAEGLLASSLIPGEAHPRRKEYQITEAGRQAFYAWRGSPVNHGRDMRQEFLAKLYFAQKSGAEVSLELINRQKSVCSKWLSDFRSRYAKAPGEQSFERMVFQFRIDQIKAFITWLDSCQAEIQGTFAPLPKVEP